MIGQLNNIKTLKYSPEVVQKIHYKILMDQVHSIAIISDKKGDGKSFTALNIAQAMTSIYGLKVYLLDINPKMNPLFSAFLEYQAQTSKNKKLSIFSLSDFINLTDQNIDIKTKVNDINSNLIMSINIIISELKKKSDLIIVNTMTNQIENSITPFNLEVDSYIYAVSKKSMGLKESFIRKEIKENNHPLLGVIYNEV